MRRERCDKSSSATAKADKTAPGTTARACGEMADMCLKRSQRVVFREADEEEGIATAASDEATFEASANSAKTLTSAAVDVGFGSSPTCLSISNSKMSRHRRRVSASTAATARSLARCASLSGLFDKPLRCATLLRAVLEEDRPEAEAEAAAWAGGR